MVGEAVERLLSSPLWAEEEIVGMARDPFSATVQWRNISPHCLHCIGQYAWVAHAAEVIYNFDEDPTDKA